MALFLQTVAADVAADVSVVTEFIAWPGWACIFAEAEDQYRKCLARLVVSVVNEVISVTREVDFRPELEEHLLRVQLEKVWDNARLHDQQDA